MTKAAHPFTPDWASPPGETITDLLEELDWTQTQLANRLGYPEAQVSQLIDGQIEISVETAHKLAEILGSTADFWLKLETIYRDRLGSSKKIRSQIVGCVIPQGNAPD